MRELSTERSSRAETTAVSLLTLVALVLLGFVLAYWSWTWLGPRPHPRVATAAEPRIQVTGANHLFGSVQRERDAALPPTGVAIKLLGVAAASAGRRGHAIVQLDAKRTVVVREEEDIGPGIRLVEVHPDHVVLERNGTRETLAWPRKDPVPAASVLPVKKR